MALAWLGLWPALDAIFRRRLRHFREAPEELVSEIASCFTSQVQRADLSQISRVAATLTRNTERDVREGRRAAWAEQARSADLPGDRELGDPVPPPELSELGLPADLDPDEKVAAIHALLVPIVGDDADLVIGAAIYGDSQHELADKLGITHEAARKRFQRALARLRPRFEGLRTRRGQNESRGDPEGSPRSLLVSAFCSGLGGRRRLLVGRELRSAVAG